MQRKLFKVGNYLRLETIHGNTVYGWLSDLNENQNKMKCLLSWVEFDWEKPITKQFLYLTFCLQILPSNLVSNSEGQRLKTFVVSHWLNSEIYTVTTQLHHNCSQSNLQKCFKVFMNVSGKIQWILPIYRWKFQLWVRVIFVCVVHVLWPIVRLLL